jgi:hypothetical protein
VSGIAEVSSDWENHSRAARAIAEEYFDSRTVLGALLRKLEVV